MEEHATVIVEASRQYVGRWNLLVSTTNWEKGRIICQWREALREAGAPPAASSDDAWSRQVGNVTPQHVGRLRRVFERFGEVFAEYAGLYWSHFQAALDWPDAEMYLQGAVENRWSVSQMREQRWEAMGGQPEAGPDDAEMMAGELDEDAAGRRWPVARGDLRLGRRSARHERFRRRIGSVAERRRPERNGPCRVFRGRAPAAEPLRPFESLPPLPPDLNEAFDLMRLAILNHKVSGWREISRADVLAALESLKQLAVAPN